MLTFKESLLTTTGQTHFLGGWPTACCHQHQVMSTINTNDPQLALRNWDRLLESFSPELQGPWAGLGEWGVKWCSCHDNSLAFPQNIRLMIQ